MPNPDRTMDVYLRLLAEKADEILSRDAAAQQLADLAADIAPDILTQLAADSRARAIDADKADKDRQGRVDPIGLTQTSDNPRVAALEKATKMVDGARRRRLGVEGSSEDEGFSGVQSRPSDGDLSPPAC